MPVRGNVRSFTGPGVAQPGIMPLSEFKLIEQYFKRPPATGAVAVELGVGDDCALLQVPCGLRLAVTTDTLVEGVHFLPDSDPEALGHKVLAVNLSDLAAMGARPAWFTLSITLPVADPEWLQAFSGGLFQLADRHRMTLVGGDTTRGPLSLTVTAMGLLPEDKALRRSGAKPGDQIYVTGDLGAAGLGLMIATGEVGRVADSDVLDRYLKPTPRVAAGQALLSYATSCIDLSDGLSSDLSHVLRASAVGASIHAVDLPIAATVKQSMGPEESLQMALSAGDDYELCFTVPSSDEAACCDALAALGCPATRIGVIEVDEGLRLLDAKGDTVTVQSRGYQHFQESMHGE